MDLETLKLLSEYNRITNLAMNELIRRLDEAQWNRKFGGYFSSIRSLCNHLYISDFNWLKRFTNLRSFIYRAEPIFEQTLRFDSHAFTEKAVYLQKRPELDGYIGRFVDELRGEDLGKRLLYKDSHGDGYDQEFGNVVLHFFNHQTHHRGMISLYLEEMGIENDYSNIMDMI